MTYEEKLDLVINERVEAQKRSRDGKQAYIYVTKQSELIKRIIPQEVHEFLLKLQDNDHILQVTDIPSELKGAMDWDIDKSDHFSFLISDVFEEWYESYIIKKESSLKNQTYLNLLRILDTMLSIREVIQLHNTTTVQIPFLPQRIRYRELMLQDDVGMRDEFIQGRWDAVGYLHKEGKIKQFKHIDSMMHRWNDNIQVTIDATSFYIYLDMVKQEVAKRLSDVEQKKKATDKTKEVSSLVQKNELQLTYDAKMGRLNILGKTIQLKKESFRAQLIELLLKDEKSSKKDWSWDEILEQIEGITEDEELKEKKDKIYNACDGLTKFIAQKTGINDLLIFNKSSVRINPKYL